MNFRLALLFIPIAILAGCEPDDPVIPNEEEVITTLSYTLTNTITSEEFTLLFEDNDGDGGAAPVMTVDTLPANSSFTGSIEISNYNNGNPESLNVEILAEAEDHQFFFEPSMPSVVIDYLDQDNDGLPLGLESSLSTGTPGNGTLTITLRHEPDKTDTGVALGDITNAGGETDIEVSFQLYVQ